jgi:hypothetical protein
MKTSLESILFNSKMRMKVLRLEQSAPMKLQTNETVGKNCLDFG